MQIKHGQNRPVTLSTVSRRGFLKSATAVAAAAALPALAQHSGSKEERILAYVGCYTPNGQGIHLFDMNPASGKLTQIKVFQGMDVPLVSTMNPSWLALDPQKKYLYAGNEISNFEGTTSGAVSAFAVDRSKGDLTFLNSISSQGSTLPSNFVGTNFTSEVIISHDGRFIYAANRLHNTIAIFDIDGRGTPKLIGEEWTRGDYPRSCNIDPSGNFLFVCNHRGDSITSFRIVGDGHRLRFTDQYTPVGSPAVIVFL